MVGLANVQASASRGERRQTYAMQVLRAVLRWHGVTMPEDPFSAPTPDAQRASSSRRRRATPARVTPHKLRHTFASFADDTT
jgi:integrase